MLRDNLNPWTEHERVRERAVREAEGAPGSRMLVSALVLVVAMALCVVLVLVALAWPIGGR